MATSAVSPPDTPPATAGHRRSRMPRILSSPVPDTCAESDSRPTRCRDTPPRHRRVTRREARASPAVPAGPATDPGDGRRSPVFRPTGIAHERRPYTRGGFYATDARTARRTVRGALRHADRAGLGHTGQRVDHGGATDAATAAHGGRRHLPDHRDQYRR